MKTVLRAAMVLAIIGLGGCSGSDVSEVVELATGETLAAASLNPAPTPGSITTSISSSGSADRITGEIETFRNPFAPPKEPPPPPIVEAPEPEPEPEPEPVPEVRPPGTPPEIRLLGFMNIGEPKVLVSYRNELETLAIGDTLEEMEVIEIESPDLTMKFEEREIKLSLFDQAWQHEGSALSSNNSRDSARPRSSTPSRIVTASPSRGATASEIPGFGPNAGKPPENQPPTPSVTGSTPESSIGTPPPGLPGLSTETGGGIGELPSFPGLDVGTEGHPGPGNLPAFPSGT